MGTFLATPIPASVYTGENYCLPLQTLAQDVGKGWETGFSFSPQGAPSQPQKLLHVLLEVTLEKETDV